MSRVEDLVHNITIRYGSFEALWEAEWKWHSDAHGRISLHGAFSVLSEFVASHFEHLTESQHQSL